MPDYVIVSAGDLHIPYHSPAALETFIRVVSRLKPDVVVLLGDMLDCYALSKHPPTFGAETSKLKEDFDTLAAAVKQIGRYTKKLVILEGNHENRIRRWAVSHASNMCTYELVDPQANLLSRVSGSKYVYVPYQAGSPDRRCPAYHVIPNSVVAMHGWAVGQNALTSAMNEWGGVTVLAGHTHLMATHVRFNPVIEAPIFGVSSGCLCRLTPWYGEGKPVNWVNGYTVGVVRGNRKQFSPAVIHGETQTCIPFVDKELS